LYIQLFYRSITAIYGRLPVSDLFIPPKPELAEASCPIPFSQAAPSHHSEKLPFWDRYFIIVISCPIILHELQGSQKCIKWCKNNLPNFAALAIGRIQTKIILPPTLLR
jgi:hypothetical protein